MRALGLAMECMGCQNVTFVHTHWFSEDTDDRGQPNGTPDRSLPVSR
jgi:hypothetical protein